MIQIDDQLTIPAAELRYTTSRSSGPGGQNVNKVETRVTLHFDVEASRTLDDEQRRRIRERLSTRINSDGVLQITSQEHRTQAANRGAVTDRFAELIRGALRQPRRRVPTRKPRRVERERLEQKRRRSDRKELRRPPRPDD